MTTSSPRPGLAPDDVIADRYRLLRTLASGGMASVWEAVDQVLERPVAVKVLHPHLAEDATFVARFRTEAVAAAKLRHPNIVSIYDTCAEGGVEAIVLELVRGRTLRAYFDEHGALHPSEAVHVLAEVAQGLAAAHRAGLVHRDVKPANILIRDDGQVLVTDFGIAKLADQTDELTRTGTMLGSVKYLAPEQVQGHPVDARTDVYALGIVLYEALTGRPPFHADTDAATALQRLREAPLQPRQIRPGVPRGLEAVVLRAMALEPSDRYDSAVELRAALLAAPTTDDPTVSDATRVTPAVAPTPTAPARAARPQQSFVRAERRWIVPTLFVVLVALAFAVAGVLIGRTDTGQRLFDRARELVTGEPAGDAEDTGAAPADPAAIVEVRDHDPAGDGTERPELVGLAVDGDPATAWQTETYSTAATFAAKGGVGVLLRLDRSRPVESVTVRTGSAGWSGELRLGDADTTLLDGDPVDLVNGADGDEVFDGHGTEADHVLVWLTAIPAVEGGFRGTIAEIEVRVG